MADVAPKTSNKKKSFGGKRSFSNKGKSENRQTFGSSKKPKLQQKSKNKIASPSSNPTKKRSKGSSGDSQTDLSENKIEKKLQQQTNTNDKKPKKDIFFGIKQKLNSNETEEAIQIIEDRIKSIESRGKLTNTATRKLRQLKILKKVAEGGEVVKPQVAKPSKPLLSNSIKRRERRKMAVAKKAVDTSVEQGKNKIQKEMKKNNSASKELDNMEEDEVESTIEDGSEDEAQGSSEKDEESD